MSSKRPVKIDGLNNRVFEIGSYFVDAKRGFIYNETSSTSVEPKVMLVLLTLCESAHDVVSQEVIFERVWPGSIFSPNSLRRCIAELRKALGDSDKTLIATHPKIGYSINANIVIPDNAEQPSPKNSRIFVLLSASVLTFIFVWYLVSVFLTKPVTPRISNMQPITASEALEDFVAPSPNELAVAFTRQINEGSRSLWIKMLAEDEEHKIDITAQNVRNLVWNSAGNTLFYLEVSKSGWRIWKTTLDQTYRAVDHQIVTENTNSNWISTLTYFDQHLYFVMKNEGERNFSVVQYNIADAHQQVLLQSSEDFTPYQLTVNTSERHIIVSGQDMAKIAVVKSLALDEENYDVKHFSLAVKQRFSIEYMEGQNGYLLNNGHRLFYLNQLYELSPLDYEHSKFIRFAKYTPNSQSIYLVSSELDTDLSLIDETKGAVAPVVNSNAMDYFPSLSPDMQHFSFYSTRYGLPQLFIHDFRSDESRLVFENPQAHLNTDRGVWSRSGKRLAFSIGFDVYVVPNFNTHEYKLFKLDIHGRVVGWYLDEQHVLIWQRNPKSSKLIKANYADGSRKTISESFTGTPFIDNADTVFAIEKQALHEILPSGGSQPVVEFPQRVKRAIRHQRQLYLKLEGNDRWYVWTKGGGLKSTPYHDSAFFSIATISEDQSTGIAISEKRSSDIIKLSLSFERL